MPRHLTEGVTITKIKLRIFFVLAIFMIAGMIGWLFFGTIRQTVTLEGIAFPQSGIRRVVSQEKGRVQQVLHHAGDYVQQGDLLAVIPQEAMLDTMQKSEITPELLTQYQNKSLITAPVSGTISDIAEVGDVVQEGNIVAKVITHDPYSNQSELRAYVPATVAATLQQGMEVEISPYTSSRESNGFLKGFLNKIGTLPITQEQIIEDLSGFSNPKSEDKEQGLIEIRVTLVGSPEIETGTICDMVVITQRSKPIEVFIS